MGLPFPVNSFTAFTPASLFRQGQQGVWFDPSDMSTLFQDSAGTTPVTAVEQPVGRMLDKSGRGNHATQSTSASRPVLSARVNLLTKTEAFDDAAWTKANTTVNANTTKTTDPLGGNTADEMLETSSTSLHEVYTNTSTSTPTLTSGVTYSWTAFFKDNGRQYVGMWFSAYKVIVFDLTNLTSAVMTTGLGSPNGTIVDVGNGWRRCTYTCAATRTGADQPGFGSSNSGSSYPSFAGDPTKGLFIWGADLRVSNDGVGLPAYQRVDTSTSYNTAGFPMYLRFDGTDDSLATGSIDFSATDKMTVWAGVRKLSDASVAILVELSSTASTNAGSFYITAPENTGASGDFIFKSRGSFNSGVSSPGAFLAPTTRMLTGIGNIAGDTGSLRINGTAYTTTNPGTQGTGNYGNYPVYIGRRGGSTLPYNGRLYGLIIRGASSNTGQITSAETWMNYRTRAY